MNMFPPCSMKSPTACRRGMGVFCVCHIDLGHEEDHRCGVCEKRWRNTAPSNATPTSMAAAVDQAGKAGTKRRAIYQFVLARGTKGATREEVEEALRMLTQTACGRLNDLEKAGLLIDSGRERTGHTGSAGKIYIADADGQAH